MHVIARRRVLVAATASATALLTPFLSWSRLPGTLRLLVGFAPGGAADALARSLVEPLRALLGSNVLVENKIGAGGRIAAEHLAGSTPDGGMLLIAPASTLTLSPHLYRHLPFQLARDFAPVLPLANLDIALLAGPVVPSGNQSPESVFSWLRDHPKLRGCGVPGLGSTAHIVALLLGREARVDWDVVPYQGDAPVLRALMGGEISVGISSLASGVAYVRSGALRALAIASPRRSSHLPGVPALDELGYAECNVEDTLAAFVHRNTPSSVFERWRDALGNALQMASVVNAMRHLSLEPASSPNGDYATALSSESSRWMSRAKSLNLRMD
jgi:tripartite-type tricarboxylate transporter receptor subunit TctC